MIWTQRGIILYPTNMLTGAQQDALALAYVNTVGLETFANERLMFDKAVRYSGDYGATETHAAIQTALTPELATAVRGALAGVAGLWYILDADSGALLDTNDNAKWVGDEIAHGLDWQPGIDVAAGEVLRHNGALVEVIQSHRTQADWSPDAAQALFKVYRAPGEVYGWKQPLGAHDAWALGARVTHNGHTWQSLIANNVWEPGAAGSETLWACEDCGPETDEWAAGIAYTGDNTAGAGNGDVVVYQGILYRCWQSHTSQVGWEPPNAPALWILIGPA